ncbi:MULTISPECIES: hypothetical protein [Lysobacter]|uniref:Uncharacterized protein n=2 Tax=Lysobacter TaxID=68 RepID=A0A0S2DHA7_LYSEN|nr:MULTISPECIES: hypothetical protein [Lysobacter]ALN57979.1 hypothetical protein GLE_2631 [Lysobacter enzymogenes]QQQ03650.1 hypothetical protein JHW41_12240 [Lysobacter enzymogenes]UZW63231.1 hypothetical protein BV903_013500 [Lysobacter enzymogenes]WMT02070.1 hypothetical protein RDV84_19200 [Lysobacter yananisis]
MSINSKARRDAKKRKLARARPVAAVGASIEPHAELRDTDGRLLGGIVRRDGEWTLGLGGRIVGGSESAARVLALLERAASLHRREGRQVSLGCSSALRRAADQELAERGLSSEQFREELEKELAIDPPPALNVVADAGDARH